MPKTGGKRLGIKEERAATQGTRHPKKRLYRARAHSNPLSDSRASTSVPTSPDDYDWSALYPAFFGERKASRAENAAEAPAADVNMSAACTASAPAGDASAARQPEPAEEGSEEAAPTGAVTKNTSGAGAGAAQPGRPEEPCVRFLDVGCGFGGLLVRLSPLFPDTLMLGMELRDKVALYVKERVLVLRREHAGQHGNIACLRVNTQKYLPNFFRKGQLTKLFFLFPDPHFKATNHRRRIISVPLLAEYAFLLAPGGRLYTATDVPELGTWMAARLDEHPLFRRLSEQEVANDIAAGMLTSATEEGIKVARNSGQTFVTIHERIQPAEDIEPS